VKARSSVFRYKGKEVEPQQVAAQLSVQAILNGRFVLRGDDVTLYLALVDARNGNQVWGEQYNRKLKDLVALQSEITRDVSQKLRARLSGADEERLAKNYTANTEAYQLYLKGRYHVLKLTRSEMQTGISYFQQAIDLDPSYALAYVGLAEVKRARELDPLDLRINGLEAQFLVHAGKPDEALALLQKNLELNPNNWFAHMFASSAYIEKGMFAEAVVEASKSRELNRFNSQPTAQLGYALAKSGKQAEARGVLEELLKRSAEHYVSPGNIALIYNGLDERDKTLQWLERGFEQRDVKMVFLKVEPKWNNLRSNSRFQDLLRRVGF